MLQPVPRLSGAGSRTGPAPRPQLTMGASVSGSCAVRGALLGATPTGAAACASAILLLGLVCGRACAGCWLDRASAKMRGCEAGERGRAASCGNSWQRAVFVVDASMD